MISLPLGVIRRTMHMLGLTATPQRICDRDEKRLFAIITESFTSSNYFAVADHPGDLSVGFMPYDEEKAPVIVYGADEIWAVATALDGTPTGPSTIHVQQVFRD